MASVGLRARPLRAALSALGIAIGTAAIVAVLGLSSSSQAGLLAEIDRLGTNLLTVEAGQSLTGGAAKLPLEAPGRITLLDHVQLLAHTGLMKDEKVYRNSMIPVGQQRRPAGAGHQPEPAVRAQHRHRPRRLAQRGHRPRAGRRARLGRRRSAWASTASTPISGSGWEASGSTSRASWSPRRWRPTSTPAPWSATRPPRSTSATSASSGGEQKAGPPSTIYVRTATGHEAAVQVAARADRQPRGTRTR